MNRTCHCLSEIRPLAIFCFLSALFLLTTNGFGERYVAPALPGERVACYISNGDNDIIYYRLPIDSKKAIDGSFDLLDKVYGVERIYWRAAQVEEILHHSLVRSEHFHHADLWKWVRHLYEDLGLDKYAVDAGHARRMSVWGVAALFDHGGHALVDTSIGSGPSPVESFIRLRHSEWIPVDKYGLRRQSGNICFAYPEARQALVAMQVKLATSANYDGLMLHTYVEQMHMRFDDEFGFNDPIVDEFKKRYGINIRTQEFDSNDLAALRGEYLTQYLRELKAALSPHHIKLGLFLNPKIPELPQYWLADTSVCPSGRLRIDWPIYISEGVVDELMVYCGSEPYETLEKVLAQAKGTSCEVSTFHSSAYPDEYKHFKDQGVIRSFSGSMYQDLEWGYFEEQPVTALEGSDFIARMSVLQQMSDGRTPPDFTKIITATKDSHVMVRRRALATLDKLNQSDPAIINALENCLNDSENTVRCYAVNILCKLGTSSSIDRVYETLDKHHNAMINRAAYWGLTNLTKLSLDRLDDLVRGLKHSNFEVRCVVVQALTEAPKSSAAALPALLKLTTDASAKVRYHLVRALSRVNNLESLQALYTLLDDSHPTVRNVAALKLSTLMQKQTQEGKEFQSKVFEKLRTVFSTYNDTYQGDDADWGWRCFGDALERTGTRGITALEEFLHQEKDRTLADHAWRILYVKHKPFWKFSPITAVEAERGYRQHPQFRLPINTQ